MSTLSHQRQRTSRQINWPLYREQRAHLADIFPAIAYSGQDKRPLALGVKYDLIGTNTGLSAGQVKHFLRAYTYGPKYLRTLKAGAVRYGLDGSPAGEVTEAEAAHATLCLRTHYEMRRAGRVGVRAVADAIAAPFCVMATIDPDYAESFGRHANDQYAYRFAREAA